MNKKNLALQISTLVVTTACFVVMAATMLFSQNLRNILTLWGEDIQMTVYLSQDLTIEQQQNIEKSLRAEINVRDVRLITQEKALRDFRAQLATYAPDLAKDDELLKMIPASYQLNLNSNLSSTDQLQSLKTIANKAKTLEGVDDVSYGQDWVEKYSSFVAATQWITQILAFIILCAAVFVMSNVVRSLVHTRREEIEVMELFGATPMMIRRPFLLQGIWMGAISTGLALVICYGGFQFMRSVFINQLSFLRLGGQLQFLGALAIVLFILAGVCLGALASYLCVRKINDGWAASQRA
jgi:cell division transport system permease protein